MPKHLAILGYHKIGAPSAGNWETWYYVPTATFETQMKQLRDGGWNMIDVATLLRALDSPDELPERAALITFDDGYRSVLRDAAPVLADEGFPAVVFVPTQFIGSASTFDANSPEPVEPICSWDELRELERAGISVQSHGVSHTTFSDLSNAQIEREISASKTALEERLEKAVTLFSYPYNDGGRDRDFSSRALVRAGYRAAFHFTGGVLAWPPAHDRFRISRVPVWPDTDLRNALS